MFDPMFAELQAQQQGDIQGVGRTGEPLVDGECEETAGSGSEVNDGEFG